MLRRAFGEHCVIRTVKQPMALPPLNLVGDYQLDNIRHMDLGTGAVRGIDEVAGLEASQKLFHSRRGDGKAVYLAQAREVGDQLHLSLHVFGDRSEANLKDIHDVPLVGFFHRELFKGHPQIIDRHGQKAYRRTSPLPSYFQTHWRSTWS